MYTILRVFVWKQESFELVLHSVSIERENETKNGKYKDLRFISLIPALTHARSCGPVSHRCPHGYRQEPAPFGVHYSKSVGTQRNNQRPLQRHIHKGKVSP